MHVVDPPGARVVTRHVALMPWAESRLLPIPTPCTVTFPVFDTV